MKRVNVLHGLLLKHTTATQNLQPFLSSEVLSPLYCDSHTHKGTSRLQIQKVLIRRGTPDKIQAVAVTKPLIQPEGYFLEVSEGATVNLICSAEGSPLFTYRWYKRDLVPGSRRVFQSGGVSLLIPNFQTSHSGTYYCEAENWIPVKTTQQSEEVHLSITAEFNRSVQQDDHGTWRSSVILPCSYSPVRSTPHSGRWLTNGLMILTRDNTRDHTFITKDRGQLSLPWESEGNNISITIMNLQTDDGGQYSCEVSLLLIGTSDLLKKEALFNLDITKVAVTKPLIQPEGSFLEVPEGARVNLTCSAEGSPPITYRWYKRDLAPGSRRLFQSGGVSLLINNFQTSHPGTYYCEAQNRIPAKTREQSDELHLRITDDTIAKVTTPKSGMGSTEFF
ncbi:Fc receptor-like protein 5 [Lissotriton helveticus]